MDRDELDRQIDQVETLEDARAVVAEMQAYLTSTEDRVRDASRGTHPMRYVWLGATVTGLVWAALTVEPLPDSVRGGLADTAAIVSLFAFPGLLILLWQVLGGQDRRERVEEATRNLAQAKRMIADSERMLDTVVIARESDEDSSSD